MDKLMTYHTLDIQWGNHDVLWMGAAAGQQACIATVLRICARYGNLDILEDGYGINMPVSYTHLDVYKRQAGDRAWTAPLWFSTSRPRDFRRRAAKS